jgi:hypothetical protein
LSPLERREQLVERGGQSWQVARIDRARVELCRELMEQPIPFAVARLTIFEARQSAHGDLNAPLDNGDGGSSRRSSSGLLPSSLATNCRTPFRNTAARLVLDRSAAPGARCSGLSTPLILSEPVVGMDGGRHADLGRLALYISLDPLTTSALPRTDLLASLPGHPNILAAFRHDEYRSRVQKV